MTRALSSLRPVSGPRSLRRTPTRCRGSRAAACRRPTGAQWPRSRPAPPGDTTITAAAWAPAANGLPRHCLVDGHVQVPGNTVRFRVGLPEGWNGKFYFQGVGGLGGTHRRLDHGAGSRLCVGVDRHRPRRRRPGLGQQPRQGDRLRPSRHARHGGRGQGADGRPTTAGRPAHAYFNGCSNGGRQALMEVQRYPGDFDGVIAGDPAFGTPMQAGRAVLFQRMLAVAGQLPAGGEGRAAIGAQRSPPATPPMASPTVSSPIRARARSIRRRSSAPAATVRAASPPGRSAVVRAVYTGLKDPAGKEYTPPFPPGHEGGSSGWRGWITGTEPPAAAARRLAGVRRQGAGRLHADGRELPFPGARRRRAGLLVAHVPLPADLPRLATMTADPEPARHRPAAVRHGRRQAARLPRLGRPRHLRPRHLHYVEAATQWPAARPPPMPFCGPTSCRACTTAAADPASTVSTC